MFKPTIELTVDGRALSGPQAAIAAPHVWTWGSVEPTTANRRDRPRLPDRGRRTRRRHLSRPGLRR